MQFSFLLCTTVVIGLFGAEARSTKTYRSFRFGETSVGLYSLSPAAKRLYEPKEKSAKSKRFNRNGAPLQLSRKQRKDNQKYLKSYRLENDQDGYNYIADNENIYNRNGFNESEFQGELASPPPINDQDSSSLPEEETTYTGGYTISTFQDAAADYANQYLKAKRNSGAQPDDLEMDYANEFLKRGLQLATDFGGSDSWDEAFIITLKRFYGNLLLKGGPHLPDLSSQWKARSGESVYKTSKLYTKHKSIDCGNLSMKLKMAGEIYGGHRNRVIKLFDQASKKYYAYKTYGNPDEFYTEQEKFLWLDHPYFVKAICHRKDLDTGKPGILFDYVDGKSSLSYARTATLEQLKNISAQLFLAIEHLHWLGIVHADLKPDNILIRKDGTVQVIDLGFATHLPQGRRKRGTHVTMAPELHYLVPGRVHEGIDWWAYGSTVAMWFGYNNNYKNEDQTAIFIPMNWKQSYYEDGIVPWRFHTELRNFLAIFFQPDPESRRFHTKRLLKRIRDDSFFDKVDWKDLHGGILN